MSSGRGSSLLIDYSAELHRDKKSVPDIQAASHTLSDMFSFSATKKKILWKQLREGSGRIKLNVLLQPRDFPLLGGQLVCTLGSASEFQREAIGAFTMAPIPGLTCIHIEKQPDSCVYHIRNSAEIPIKLRQIVQTPKSLEAQQ